MNNYTQTLSIQQRAYEYKQLPSERIEAEAVKALPSAAQEGGGLQSAAQAGGHCAAGTLVHPGAHGPTRTASRMLSMHDLLSRPHKDTVWLVDGLLHAGGSSLLVAKAKKGKSTLARQLAMAVSKGYPFLGRATRQGSVVYLALEDQENERANRFRLLGATENDPIEVQLSLTGQTRGDFVNYIR